MAELITAILGLTAFLLVFDFVFIRSFFISCIRKGGLTKLRPEFKGTRKVLVWTIIWSISFFLNIPLFIGVSFALGSTEYLLLPFMISFPAFAFEWVIIYLWIEYIVFH